MSVMLICTLGSRDLQLSGEMIVESREKGREIFENFDRYYPDLTYPIIRPVLDHIFEEKKQERIGRVVLVATDQTEDTNPKFRQKDTIEFARILQKMIDKKYGAKIGQIKILKIPENPTYLDAMYDFFGNRLKYDKAFKSDNVFNMEELDICYVEQTGGIPSANMALLYQCINRFHGKCHPVNISEKYGAVPIPDFVGKVMRDWKKGILSALTDKYDYASMSVHLDEGKENEKFILRLSRYAQHRLYFDTLTARTVARQAIGEFSSEKNVFGSLISELKKIESGDYVSLILELFYNMRIKYLRKEFVDFLGRLYRFQEAVPRYLIEREFGISTDVDPKTGKQTELDRLLESDEELKGFIASQKMPKGGNIDPSRVGTPRLVAFLDFLIEKKGMNKFHPISEFFKKTEKLMKIRNKSIVAHGFDGISEEIIKENYGGDVFEDLKAVVSSVLKESGQDSENDPFEKINRLLIGRIGQL